MLFEQQEKPLLMPLPAEPFVIGPAISWRLIITSASRVLGALPADRPARRCVLHVVSIFHKGQRVAAHARQDAEPGRATVTLDEQPNHRAAVLLTPETIRAEAAGLGGALVLLADRIFADADHPDQAARQVCCDWASCTAPRLCKPPRRPR